MQIHRLAVALIVLASVAACGDQATPPPTPIATGPISLPGERASSHALTLPPDEWAGPGRQTAEAPR